MSPDDLPPPGDASGGPAPDDSIPASARWIHRVLLLGLLAVYFFLSYCILRALLGSVGGTFGTIAKALLATAAMGAFIVWAVPLAEVPQIVFRHLLPQRRARRGRCPHCGYDRRDRACPECGFAGAAPGPWQLGWSTVRRFGVVLLVGFLLGAVTGEVWTSLDERRFAAESVGRPAHVRPRAWPADFANLAWDPRTGVSAVDPFQSPRIEGWRPKDRSSPPSAPVAEGSAAASSRGDSGP